MANKITNLRNWINGEVFNARDYVYERNLIVSLVNNHEDRIQALETFDANIGTKYLDKTVTTDQSVAGIVDFTQGIEIEGRVINITDRLGTDLIELELFAGQFITIGVHQVFIVKYTENVSKGDAIQFAGTQGGHFLAKRAVQSEINAAPERFIGLAFSDASTNDYGAVITFGPLYGILDEAFPAESILWFDSEGSTPGALTKDKPARGYAQIRVSAVINTQNAEKGTWMVRPSILEASSGIQTFLQDTEPENLQPGDLWFDTSGGE